MLGWLVTAPDAVDGPVGLDELVHPQQWMAWAAYRDEPGYDILSRPRPGHPPRQDPLCGLRGAR